MAYESILFEKKDGVAVITLNRPDVRNAMARQGWMEIRQAMEEVKNDEKVKVVIFTGAGDKAFSAGADVRELNTRSMIEDLDNPPREALCAIENLPKPVIAAVNGYALGGGCELAMACDMRIASERARFGQPEIALGIHPGAGGTQRLPRLVGMGKAKELLFTGDIIDAGEAKEMGLVNRVVQHEKLMETAMEMAGKILSKAPLAVSMIKAAVNEGMQADLRVGLAIEKFCHAILFTTEDRLEGTKAFLEKRAPRFKGK